MKKVLYVISTLRRTGPTNILAGTALNLDGRVFKPMVLTLSPEEDENNSWKQELQSKGIEVHSLNLSRIKGIFCAGRALKRKIEEIKPDIIHTHCFRSAVYCALFVKGYKRVSEIHCDYEEDYALAYGGIKGAIMAKVFTWALSSADKRVCCSQMLAAILRRKKPDVDYAYVNNGVDTEKFKPYDGDKAALRRVLKLPLDKRVFIWAGVFIKIKDFPTLAKAAMALKEENNFFVFCGDGPLLSEMQTMLNGQKNIMFTGFCPEIHKYLQAADFYISTSLTESFHLTVYEALSCGLPVILSDIEAYSNLRGNEAVSFFKTGDYKELAKAIGIAAQEYSPAKGEAAVKMIRDSYSLQKMAEGYGDLYLNGL